MTTAATASTDPVEATAVILRYKKTTVRMPTETAVMIWKGLEAAAGSRYPK
ncbi:MAG TPA: hypothetical protein VFW34_11090 [Candidatus Rubrimentiphilum sp.]|nr:hypothetical protein [Candidatus Rubrimentiphilum sp.]